MKVYEVKSLRCDDARDYLAELIERLDDLDESDYFGRSGWREMLMGEEKTNG